MNAKGEFNTPVGSNKNPNLYSRDNLLAASAALQDAQLEAQDFRKTVDEARRGDRLDLPRKYRPRAQSPRRSSVGILVDRQ